MYVCNYPFNVSEISLLSKQLFVYIKSAELLYIYYTHLYFLGYQL